MDLEIIARICHEANRAYCESIGDKSQQPWESLPEAIRESVVSGVRWRMGHPNASMSELHDEWVRDKREQGWVYGTDKDMEKKIHPCLVAYEELPPRQRVKDLLFAGIVDSLRRVN